MSSSLRLTPVDSWFFRDSDSYDQGDPWQASVKSLLVPAPSTVSGALRRELARSQGWDGRGRWSAPMQETLGPGHDDSGSFMFSAPTLYRADVAFFPLPATVFGRRDSGVGRQPWQPVALARPGGALTCDLGTDVRLLDTAEGSGHAASLPDAWVSAAGLKQIVKGQLPGPDEVVESEELMVSDARVGLERDPATHTTKALSHQLGQPTAIYSPEHVRYRPGVALVVEYDPGASDWDALKSGVMPFGGESRMAGYDASAGSPSDVLHGIQEGAPSDAEQFAVFWLSPGDVKNPLPSPGEKCPELGGVRVVAIAGEEPMAIGGWDSTTREPVDLRPHVRPGTVWFCEGSRAAAAQMLSGVGARSAGRRANLGYGQVVFGLWPQS